MYIYAEKTIIVTNGQFSVNAYEFEQTIDGLELMEDVDIEKMILNLNPHQISKIIFRIKNVA